MRIDSFKTKIVIHEKVIHSNKGKIHLKLSRNIYYEAVNTFQVKNNELYSDNLGILSQA